MAGVVAIEGVDRPDASMLNGQDRMIDELLGVNDRTVVVLKDSSPVLMPWIDRAPAVLEAWNQGTEDGHVRSAVWRRHPVGQAADHLPGLRARHALLPRPGPLPGHLRGPRLPGDPLHGGS
jgi:Glycosyl hydrolase family 3 C-terminal domain